jgi:tetratricopeptide (TPR) repeat protein
MPIFSRSTEAGNRTARQSFLFGERSLRAYLAGGNVRFLEDAEASFAALKPRDKEFDSAQFYLGVAKTQLRKTDESIRIFQGLRNRTTGTAARANAGFEDQVSLQLAYAHIKNYEPEGFWAAEQELNRVAGEATAAGNRQLLLQTKAIQVFLYSVLSGRSTEKGSRPEYANRALALGNEILGALPKTLGSAQALRCEALNALGITWMRIGEAQWPGFANRATSWANAQSYYDQALEIIPSSLRVLQNLAKLRLLQADVAGPSAARARLEEAKEYCERSLTVSDRDQYPFYLLARIALGLRNPEAAWEYIHTGRTRPGAVKDEDWAKLEAAARSACNEEPL